MIDELLCPIAIVSMWGTEGEGKLNLLSYRTFSYNFLYQCPVSLVINILAIRAGNQGSIPCMVKSISKIPFSPFGVTKLSSLVGNSEVARGIFFHLLYFYLNLFFFKSEKNIVASEKKYSTRIFFNLFWSLLSWQTQSSSSGPCICYQRSHGMSRLSRNITKNLNNIW